MSAEMSLKYKENNNNVGLKTLLCQCLSEREFHSDLVHTFKNMCRTDISDHQFRTMIIRYKCIDCSVLNESQASKLLGIQDS